MTIKMILRSTSSIHLLKMTSLVVEFSKTIEFHRTFRMICSALCLKIEDLLIAGGFVDLSGAEPVFILIL